jgi:hypothetical protein
MEVTPGSTRSGSPEISRSCVDPPKDGLEAVRLVERQHEVAGLAVQLAEAKPVVARLLRPVEREATEALVIRAGGWAG